MSYSLALPLKVRGLRRVHGAKRSDAAVVTAIAGGDADALAEAYDRHGAAVYAFARCLVVEPHHAEEVTCEVFRSLRQSPADFPLSDGSLRIPLLLRAHAVATALPDVNGAPQGISEDDDRPATCLAQLPTAEAVAIGLACFGGLHYQDVATLVGQPKDVVAADMRHGLSRLTVGAVR